MYNDVKKGLMVVLAGAFVVAVAMGSLAEAQVIHPDQLIGLPDTPMGAIPEGGVTTNEPAIADLEKGLDRPMMAPESGTGSSSDGTMLLKTPDATDAENARESDRQSAMSF
ncbi:MAG: hypothetical protein NBKEAIPA_00602 [Nitrospirae bacterium]|nr:MAG: hypothetical protein UZ03_NOB001001294 [Nitrospira sp. OLB3]MBV6468730.1 hypothetical protein [Nitrospirota bacterium]MCE7964063.1 hypothetical protein [Nitrospira sp. NTP2]MCK6492746.1 hypothetical protein [Nitrospira sp.]MEB2337087.1 hypothetical protein [Nitrospirales bacterium]